MGVNLIGRSADCRLPPVRIRSAPQTNSDMNRVDLQQLAEARVQDTEALLSAGRWPAAYYLLGYAIECALKACAARQFREHEVPDKATVNNFYTHKLDLLLNISGAKAALETRTVSDPAFLINWNRVRDWSEASRYDPLTSEATARGLYEAVTDPDFGVMPWLKTFW